MDVKPLDDISTYRKVADAAYSSKREPSKGVPAITRKRMENAELGELPPVAPAAHIPGVKFTKPFSRDERIAQEAALLRKRKELGQ